MIPTNKKIDATFIKSALKDNKNIEVLFENGTEYDKRKKLNLQAESKIDIDTINKIETEGITSEILETLDTTVLKYKTQVTLHSDFSKLTNDTVFNYKSLLLNKNNSLGVKYVAIDEIKRKRLAKYLNLVGYTHISNSTESHFCKVINITNNDDSTLQKFESMVKDFNLLKENNHLYVGEVYVKRISIYGEVYMFLQLFPKLIKQENVIKIAELLGSNDTLLKAEIERKKSEYDAYVLRIKQDNESRKILIDNATDSLLNDGRFKQVNIIFGEAEYNTAIEIITSTNYLNVEPSCPENNFNMVVRYNLIIAKKSARKGVYIYVIDFDDLESLYNVMFKLNSAEKVGEYLESLLPYQVNKKSNYIKNNVFILK